MARKKGRAKGRRRFEPYHEVPPDLDRAGEHTDWDVVFDRVRAGDGLWLVIKEGKVDTCRGTRSSLQKVRKERGQRDEFEFRVSRVPADPSQAKLYVRLREGTVPRDQRAAGAPQQVQPVDEMPGWAPAGEVSGGEQDAAAVE